MRGAARDHGRPVTARVDFIKGETSRGELVARLFFEHYTPRLTSETPVGSDGWYEPPRDR